MCGEGRLGSRLRKCHCRRQLRRKDSPAGYLTNRHSQPSSLKVDLACVCGAHLMPSAVWEAMTASASMPPELMTACTGGCPCRVRITSATCDRQV